MPIRLLALLIILCSTSLWASNKPQAKKQNRKPAQVEEEFTVKTISTKKPLPPTPIQLLSPPHKSELTPGVVTFTWQQNEGALDKVQLMVEKIDQKKKYVMRTKASQKRMYCASGSYRWKVTGVDAPIESRWRTFRVITLKSRGMASSKSQETTYFLKEKDDIEN